MRDPADPRTGKPLTWYMSTRHSFAKNWVRGNGSIEKLAAQLGRSSTEVTRRYAPERTDYLLEADRKILAVDLLRAGAEVVALTAREQAPGRRG